MLDQELLDFLLLEEKEEESVKEEEFIEDSKEFIDYLTAQANIGDVDAMESLGMDYCYGIHVDENVTTGIVWLTKAANKGNLEAIRLLSQIYHGWEGYVNDEKSFEFTHLGARMQDELCMYNLAYFYLDGIGVKRNPKKALKWAKKLNNYKCMNVIKKSEVYEAVGDYEKAIEYVKMAEELDDLEERDLFNILLRKLELCEVAHFDCEEIISQALDLDGGFGGELLAEAIENDLITIDEGIALVEKKSKDNPSLYQIIVDLYDGLIEGYEDYEKMIEYAEKGIEIGYVPDYHDLFEYYRAQDSSDAQDKAINYLMEGVNLNQSSCILESAPIIYESKKFDQYMKQEIIDYVEMLADDRYPLACDVLLELMYYHGYQSDDHDRMLELARFGESEGLICSESILGQMLFEGYDEKPKYKIALRHLRNAAGAGDAEACKYLGLAYFKGLGVIRDRKKAIKWFKKASESLETVDINLIIYLIYHHGFGVIKSEEKAKLYYEKAVECLVEGESIEEELEQLIKELEIEQ